MKSLNVLLIFVAIFSSTDMALGLTTKMKVQQTTPGDGCVWLYDTCNYAGTKKEYCSDTNSMPDFNDKVLSVKLGKSVSLMLYQHSNYDGDVQEISADNACLSGQTLDKNASSLKLMPATGCVWLYEHCSYGGSRKIVCSNGDTGDFNDKASSIRVGENTIYRLFEHSGYGGKSIELSDDVNCLTNNSFNDMVSSIQIYTTVPKAGCVWLYEHCNFEGAMKEYCSDQGSMPDFNEKASSLKLGKNTKTQLFENNSYGGSSVNLISDTSCLVNNNFNDKASSLRLYQITSLAERLEFACGRHSPVIYIHGDEEYFPVKIETLGINWTGVNLSDTTAKLSYTVSKNSLDWNAPLYTKVKKVDNTYQCVYAVIFGYNDCGPTATITAMVASNIGNTGVDNERVYLCPAGVHNGDIEHVIVTLDTSFKPKTVTFAYHSWDNEYGVRDVQWEGTHPVGFMAKGSHALYSSAAEQKYLKLWDERSGTNSQCTSTCYTTVSAPYPCGLDWCGWYPCTKTCYEDVDVPYTCLKDCWIGAYTSGYFLDFTAKTKKWIPPVRLIASNAHTVTATLSTDERNILQFQGRFGQDIKNEGWQIVQYTIRKLTAPVTEVCSSCNSVVESGLSAANSELQSEAPTSLATKGWWKD